MTAGVYGEGRDDPERPGQHGGRHEGQHGAARGRHQGGVRLLVSVRDRDECQEAVLAGADLIDLKEPQAGSLGAPPPEVIAEIAAWLPAGPICSVALGELRDDPVCLARHLPPRVTLAKLGLAGCQNDTDWQTRLRQVWSLLPAHVSPVGVAYADADRAASPPWEAILEVATSRGCPYFLVDTFTKDGRTLLDYLDTAELQRIQAAVSARSMNLVLAGALRAADCASLASVHPQVLAIRSAACPAGRNGEVHRDSIREFLAAMSCCGLREPPARSTPLGAPSHLKSQ